MRVRILLDFVLHIKFRDADNWIFFPVNVAFSVLFCDTILNAVGKAYPCNPMSHCYCVILSLEKNSHPFSLAL